MAANRTSTSVRTPLPHELREERRQAGRTQREVADEMDWSESKIYRIEKGEVGISTTDLKALLSYYRVTDEDRISYLIRMRRAGREAGPPGS
ncbi:helix-turn-helix domain-containing protein [Pseudofrankia inefficax]|uniref:Helix-turn-helix domain protein n=1 Tax=Pseudofrankia inefficax (strain DSM 45817 / CECT 9037 / DDB 130130 / EuI1c) TaxID=298654 RepID=E3JCN0_PSEI1|nr:helix-turn-helix transcriptional regulator [Pseudofrankia inefficax]ADP78726.1 helix-turn-helix domain protein [Pseudofrankia inefficax]